MSRLVILITLVSWLLLSGCKSTMNLSSSSFFSSFSLEELVKQDGSSSGKACAKGGMGGMGGGTFSVGREKSSNNKIYSFACQIDRDSFDETAFLGSLKAGVEQAINRSGATIVNRGGPDPAGFYFEYSEPGMAGRISVEGKQSGANYYSLVAKLGEERGAK